MARTKPRRKHTRRFDVGKDLPPLDGFDSWDIGDLVQAALPYLDADQRKDLGLADQSDGEKVGEDFEIGEYVRFMDQEETFDLVYHALPHLDEAEIFQLVLDELSPAGRERLLKRLEEEAWKAA
jgi:hypothetical protein